MLQFLLLPYCVLLMNITEVLQPNCIRNFSFYNTKLTKCILVIFDVNFTDIHCLFVSLVVVVFPSSDEDCKKFCK